jgi:hypothetical protein
MKNEEKNVVNEGNYRHNFYPFKVLDVFINPP